MEFLILFIILVGLYFLPSIAAIQREKNTGMVFVLNLFLGWTIIGWVVSLALAMADKAENKPSEPESVANS